MLAGLTSVATLAIALAVADAVIAMLMPQGRMEKYVRFVWGVLGILIIAARFVQIAGGDTGVFAQSLESREAIATAQGSSFYQQALKEYIRGIMGGE